MIMSGSPGTGKTFLGMAMGLLSVLDKGESQEKLIIVRSIVPTRSMGYLKGTEEEKVAPYMAPYIAIASQLINLENAWDRIESSGQVEFVTTSFIRGTTFDDAVILVDECQNLNFHELDSIVTRLGRNSRIIFSGDYYQSDFTNNNEKKGILQFMKILVRLKNFSSTEFTWADCVRSDFVRDYLMTKEIIEKEKDDE